MPLKINIIWKRNISPLRNVFHVSVANKMWLWFRWNRVNNLSNWGCKYQNILSFAVLLLLMGPVSLTDLWKQLVCKSQHKSHSLHLPALCSLFLAFTVFSGAWSLPQATNWDDPGNIRPISHSPGPADFHTVHCGLQYMRKVLLTKISRVE